MNIYLAGPMRGYPQFNFPAFDYAAAKLRNMGFDVFSPADADRARWGKDFSKRMTTGSEEELARVLGTTPLSSRRQCFLVDTHYICTKADAIALLPGWEKSSGVKAEKALAETLGLTVIILGDEYVNHGTEGNNRTYPASAKRHGRKGDRPDSVTDIDSVTGGPRRAKKHSRLHRCARLFPEGSGRGGKGLSSW